MLARFLHSSKVYDYENHRSKPYQETMSGVGVHRTLRPQAVHAEKEPDNIVQSPGHAIKRNSGKAVVFGTQSQPLGETVSRTGCRRPPEQARPGSQTHNGLNGRGSRTAGHREGQAQCHEDQGEMGQQATGKEACRDTYRAFLSALAQDLDV